MASLKRNLLRHEKEEQKEGFNWSAWQTEALRGIRHFRSDNRTIMSEYSDTITRETEAMLRDQYAEGGADGFFHTNDPKLETLIAEMQTIQQDVKKAALRTMDDVYRQTIYQASAFANTRTMTIQQATDLATKQFLERGIQCIRYKNGRMVNIDTYAEMALRTNATRARLLSDAKQREQLGIDTVLVSQYGACSPTCLPWQGRVYIDDFFGTFKGRVAVTYGISAYDGKSYPLLSWAVKNGLFHPNCRHTVTTWIPGISSMPQPLNEQSVRRAYELERKQRTLESRLRSTKRLATGTLDTTVAKRYAQQAHTLQKQLRTLMDANPDVLRRDYWREQTHKVGASGLLLSEMDARPPTQITNSAILKVPEIAGSTYSDDNYKFIKQQHQELLRVARDENNGFETAFVFSSDFSRKVVIKGTEINISFPNLQIGPDLLVMHNHPRNSSYSTTDIIEFLSNDLIKTLSIVKNNGGVELLTKTNTYDRMSSRLAYSRIIKKINGKPTQKDLDNAVLTWLNKMNGGGIEWIHE